MSSMPLVQIHGVNDVRVDTVDIPVAGDNDVVIRVSNCGICGSDFGYIAMGGLTPPDTPMPIGHELSGTIESVGSNVRHLRVGQRVTVNPEANNHSIGNGGLQGGFAPFLLVKDAANYPDAVLLLPDGLSFDEGALIEPLSVAMHGVNQSGIRAGQSAVVLGAGPIGLCVVTVLQYLGVENIVVADQSAPRLAVAKKLGANAVCNVNGESLEECLVRAHGTADVMGMPVPGTDVYIEATGVGPVLEKAIALAKVGASVVVLGVHKASIQLDPLMLLIKELRLTGSMAYPTEFPAVIEMLNSGKVDVMPLISHHYNINDFMAALKMAENKEQAVKVMVTMEG